jgi:signal transduction histidine kinase
MRVRLVHLEDDEGDRELVARTLRSEGIDCAVVEAECREDFERALDDPPDLILSDYSIPGFGGDEAQGVAQHRCPDVPFVFVSGSIGEERAVERLKNGATDYVLKDRLDKLGTAVKRALREAEDRRRRAAAEATLRQLNAQLEARVIERTRELLAANDELRRARHEADRENLAKSEFLSRMSHALRTPVNGIMGFAQLLDLDDLTPNQADGVRHILRGGEHLLSLINEVLDIARIDPGKPLPAPGEYPRSGHHSSAERVRDQRRDQV